MKKSGDFKPFQHVYSIQHAYLFEPHAHNHTSRLYHIARLFDTLEYNLYILVPDIFLDVIIFMEL
jgi:hypothetical protein